MVFAYLQVNASAMQAMLAPIALVLLTQSHALQMETVLSLVTSLTAKMPLWPLSPVLMAGRVMNARHLFAPATAPPTDSVQCLEFAIARKDSLEMTAPRLLVTTALMDIAHHSETANALQDGKVNNVMFQFAWITAPVEENAFDLDSVIVLRDGLARVALNQLNKTHLNVFTCAANTVSASKVFASARKAGSVVIAVFEFVPPTAAVTDTVR